MGRIMVAVAAVTGDEAEQILLVKHIPERVGCRQGKCSHIWGVGLGMGESIEQRSKR